MERERRKSAKNRPIDPRSAARTPAANRMPHYKLRYLDPTNQQEVASPSRIADHNRPWDEEGVLDGMRSSQGQQKLSNKRPWKAPPFPIKLR